MQKNQRRLTPIKSIRAKCFDCSGGYTKEIRNCVIPECNLYPYRLGKRGTDEDWEKHHKTLSEFHRKQKLASKGQGFSQNNENGRQGQG